VGAQPTVAARPQENLIFTHGNNGCRDSHDQHRRAKRPQFLNIADGTLTQMMSVAILPQCNHTVSVIRRNAVSASSTNRIVGRLADLLPAASESLVELDQALVFVVPRLREREFGFEQ
jgi:hypothetical protein